jgi:hypothetical protein
VDEHLVQLSDIKENREPCINGKRGESRGEMSMSKPRRKLFGPLFYSTLLAAVLVAIYAGRVWARSGGDGCARHGGT